MKWLERWLGAKSAPAGSPTPVRMTDWWGMQSSSGFARSTKSQIDEVFVANPVGHRAVRLVTGAVGGLAIDVSGEGAPEVERLIHADGLLETVAIHLLLHGNAYVQAVGSDEAPSALVALRPERVSIAATKDGRTSGFAYRSGSSVQRIGQRDALERLQVLHLKSCHPGDEHYGLGCLSAAIAPASVHNAAAKWNQSLLNNAARPSGALIHRPADDTPLTDAQFTRLKDELSKQYTGAMQAGRPLLLDGGLEWKPFSMSPAEMDFVKLKEASARDIALAFGVPPLLLGLPGDATYANYSEAGRALYRQTVLPMARKILSGLERLLEDHVGPISLTIDEDQLSELMEDRAKLWAGLKDADFLTTAEKREMLGFPAVPAGPTA